MNTELKAKIVNKNGVYRYYDKEGNELHPGDIVIFEDGREEKIYLTENNELGTDATNPVWIKTGRAVACEYGIYPLAYRDMGEIMLKK